MELGSVRYFLRSNSTLWYSLKRKFTIFCNVQFARGKYDPKEDYSKYYESLGLPNESDQEAVRQKFISLAKKYHPDSGSPDADTEKFQQIEAAFRKLREKFWLERKKANEVGGEFGLFHEDKEKVEVVDQDIKHTAPQHRQYLSFDGIGSGTPSEREKQYQKHKASTAVQNVYEHRINKLNARDVQTLIVKDKQRAKNIKTRYGMDRLVEDLIQESMSRGEFDNLSGHGKPLPQKIDINPYVDFTTHKLNQKEIREEKECLLREIHGVKQKLSKPITYEDMDLWKSQINKWKDRVTKLNSKINKYNLLVPILMKQMLLFDLTKTCDDLLKEHTESSKEEDRVKS
ncbi:hypothetical protein M8J76_010981 [Diaphorina citri]|nr:hypothetical protein M8J76_010981 [Diaphorina citri]